MKLNDLTTRPGDLARLTGIAPETVRRELARRKLVKAMAGVMKAMRESRRMTRTELGRRVGLAGAARVSQYESGDLRHSVNLKNFAVIAQELGYDLEIQAVNRATGEAVSVDLILTGDELMDEEVEIVSQPTLQLR